MNNNRLIKGDAAIPLHPEGWSPLAAVYDGCVQGGHAVAQFLIDNPQEKRTWNNDYLIYLYAEVEKWKKKLDLMRISYSEFREPDLDNQLTAIAVQYNDSKFFKSLQLVA